MKTLNLKLLTIICEPVLTQKITDRVRKVGATGFTLTEVRGEGSSHRNSGEVPDLKVKIEVLATENTVEKLMEEISAHYFEDYSVITYSIDANAIRANKF